VPDAIISLRVSMVILESFSHVVLPNGKAEAQRRICRTATLNKLPASAKAAMLPSADRRCRLQRVLGTSARF